ncbi:radical SAM protein [Candidatus Fermentibacterales bacterium]|nr:radical SAM protein [Candidatus Fermentibacterales bacterium]
MFRSGQRVIAPPGLHHFRAGDGLEGCRMHLRVEGDGSGILLFEASRVLHLNRTATDMAYLILSGLGTDSVVRRLRRAYRGVSKAGLIADLSSVREAIECISTDRAVCPVTYLGLDRIEPFSTPVTAPYRADLALTYRCNVACAHCYNPKSRAGTKELSLEEWRQAMRKLWGAGVPHVAFTGGEPTLRDDLPDLVGSAEAIGMVTGLLSNGVRLADAGLVGRLADEGLDYVQITLESADPGVHDSMVGASAHEKTVTGLRNCIGRGLYCVTNTTITRQNAGTLESTLDLIAGLGLRSAAFNSIIHSGRAVSGSGGADRFELPIEELSLVLRALHEKADDLGLRLIWYTPTRYCELDPVELELGPKRCTAGLYNICVEPDGEVLPCQSYYESAGNILREGWEAIYGSPLMRGIRERTWIEEECRSCDRLDLCGGGCPLSLKDRPGSGLPLRCADSMSNPS